MIRQVTNQDAEQIATLYNHYINNSTISFEEVPVTAEDIQTRIKKVLDSDLPWLVSDTDGNIEGYAYATKWSERTAYRFTVESTVYVAHDLGHGGVGTALYSALFEQLKSQSIQNVLAVVALPNGASIKLHEKFGFDKVGQYQKIGFKFDRWIDVSYWQLVLN